MAEARSYFESSLRMNAGDCDSLRYLGLRDSAELAQKQIDSSGLLIGQIASLVADIAEARTMSQLTSSNADVSARPAEPEPLRYLCG